MWSLVWLAIFACSASAAYNGTTNMFSHELLNFNIGEFQGLIFASHVVSSVEHASSISPAAGNKSMDVMTGEFNAIYRLPHVSAVPAQNISLATYKMTRTIMMSEGNNDCHSFDFNLSLVSIVALNGNVQICTGSGGYWSLVGKPCISVFGYNLGCTELNLSSTKVSSCWDVNVALAKASVCGVVQNNCLRFNGKGCYFNFTGWTCKDFDAQATCW